MSGPFPRSFPSISRILLAMGLIAAIVSLAWVVIQGGQVQTLTLAAGDPEGESYILSQAIAQVVNANHPHLQITVLPTTGTDENLQLLEQGKVQLATAQADVPAGPKARAIAVLYRDLFQLVVRPNSGVRQFTDLEGRTILLQPNSGEFYSFMELAEHYGFTLNSFDLNFVSNQDADELFRRQQADAMFRVRTLNNDYIATVVRQAQGQLVALEQAEALRVLHPTLEAAIIPKGVYQGNPAIPTTNLATIAVQRLLLTRRDLDNATVRTLTQILGEHRREIASTIPQDHAELRPLVANFKRPSPTAGTGVPQHPGAIAYYDRDRPTLLSATLSFLISNAGVFIALTTLPAGSLIGLWEWWQRWKQQADERKGLGDRYIQQAIQNMDVQMDLPPRPRQKQIRDKQTVLEQVFNEAANAVVREQISQEAFRTFNDAYKTTREVLERCMELTSEELSDSYIQQLVTWLALPPPSPVARQQALNELLQQVETSLIEKEISQESFRTFIEAYKMTRDILMDSPFPIQPS